MDDSDFDSELWVSGEESDYDEDDEIVQYAPRAGDTTFNLELTLDAEAGDVHTRNRPGQIQREVATEFYGGRKKRPAFNVGAVAKAIVHGTLDQISKTPATLLVYDFKFFSHRSTRIKDANISFEFQAKRGSNSLGPMVTAIAPYAKHIMMRTTETVTRTIGGDAGIQGGSVVTGNASVYGEKSVEKITTHAAEVVGNNPADEWSNRFLAQWSLSENDSQASGIMSLFRACILLTRDNDEEFYLYPTVGVTPDLRTQLKAPLWGFRRPDDPIKIVPTSTAVNRLGDIISSSNLSSGINNLWDCTFYTTFEDAIKASRPRVTTEDNAEKVMTVEETKTAVP
ncbi:uncharacterized protein GGS22DRAFT_155677 [Annulohypoxylon maeteangense]|uniref:uncharacterized protein n=1 Tax=Annulohypoxylon maeteangense TaxID=1927788 RepID=UPI002007E6E7|nr:uncharacterized protein GGS22DRAFT_155677 [Annulohypoxylon maeteangense]KAI0888362.1 hypothetical protein GGS22DRAFT_155677 [Annulohypoxylon maeteangense]